MRILVVEDNLEFADWLSRVLRKSNFAVDCVHDGEDANLAMSVGDYSLVLLDLGLPKRSGLSVLREMRHRGVTCPAIILTAEGDIETRVKGLDEGADDYVVKPVDITELEARIRVQLRRSHRRAAPVLTCGPLSYDTRIRSFFINNTKIELTPREHGVLEHLLMNAGEVVKKSQIYASIFGFEEEADESAIEIYIHRLRKKLEGTGVQIRTLRGLGYVLQGNDNQ